MNIDEQRIKCCGIDGLNVVDLVIFDVVAGLMSDLRKLDCWQTVAQNDQYCKMSYSEIFGNVKWRLQGIINNTDSLRKRIDRLLKFDLLDKYPASRVLFLRPGENFRKLSYRNNLIVTPKMTIPTEAEVEAFFRENGLSDWKGFYDYNNQPSRGWTIGWNRAPMVEWHSLARRWKNYGYGRKKGSADRSVTKAVGARLPLHVNETEYQAMSPDNRTRYRESKQPDGNKIYVLIQ